MIPGVILLTPHFILANDLDLRGSLWGLVIFYMAGGLPFGIFLITTFFRSQPAEIFEAARSTAPAAGSRWSGRAAAGLPDPGDGHRRTSSPSTAISSGQA